MTPSRQLHSPTTKRTPSLVQSATAAASPIFTTVDSFRKLNAEADATLHARRTRKRARCQAISLLTQPIVSQGVFDLEGWITMYSRPLMQLPSIPPPGMGDLKDMPMHNIIQQLDTFAMSNIVEVNNVLQDHPPNPPAPSDDNEAD
ncbi:hypothetical protein CF326_g9749, partial [Tilletia indica]